MLGSVTLRVLLQALADGNEGTTAAELVQPVDFVPDAMSCDDLLVHFRATRRHLALVVDSNGTVLGLVTMEDVIEQLVGEIVDETDKEERKVLRLANGDLLVDATVETMELAATLDIKLPAGRLGELVVQNEGRIPVLGESLQLEGLSMVVEKATPSHLVQLRVKKST